MLKFAGRLVGAVITTAFGQGAVIYLRSVGYDLPSMVAAMTEGIVSSGAANWFLLAIFASIGWFTVEIYNRRRTPHTADSADPLLIPDMRALDYPKIKRLLDDKSDRRKFIEMLRNGTLTTWAYQNGDRDHQMLTPGHWKNASLAYEVVDGAPVTNVLPNNEKRIVPWTNKPKEPTLCYWHDVWFNKEQLRKHWPGRF